MDKTTRRALRAVQAAAWLSAAFAVALLFVPRLGAESIPASPGVFLMFWCLLAFAIEDRIMKEGATGEHACVALVQATLVPGAWSVTGGPLGVVVGYGVVAATFLVAAVLLQRAVHAARPDERTPAERRAHRRLGIGAALVAVLAIVLAPRIMVDPRLPLLTIPVYLLFLGWAAVHGSYVGVTRVLLLVLGLGLGIAALVCALRGSGTVAVAALAVLAGVAVLTFAGRTVPR